MKIYNKSNELIYEDDSETIKETLENANSNNVSLEYAEFLMRNWKTKNGHDAYITYMIGYFPCGYIEVPKQSPLYGLSYQDPMPNVTKEWLDNFNMGKRGLITILTLAMKEDDAVPLEVYFDVHGSLTYSEDSLLHKKKSWFLGFDCGHAQDDDDPKDEKYVEEECESLSRQIIEYEQTFHKIIP